MGYTGNDESHSSSENMDNLLLRMFVFRHATASVEPSHHLIHRPAVDDRAAPDTRHNVDPGILVHGFHHTFLAGVIGRINSRVSSGIRYPVSQHPPSTSQSEDNSEQPVRGSCRERP